MMRCALLLCLALAPGCSLVAPAPPARPEVPQGLAACPGPAVVPPAPRAPRTVESIARWGTAIDAALVRSEAARAECSRRLAGLNAWIKDHP